MKESKKIISQEPSNKPFVLTIKYKVAWNNRIEVFKNVKTKEAAGKIVSKRIKENMLYAFYNSLKNKETQEIRQISLI